MNRKKRAILLRELEKARQFIRNVEEVKKEVEIYEQEPIVQNYLFLKQQLNELIETHYPKNDNEILNRILSDPKIHNTCTHPIYLYYGSHGRYWSHSEITDLLRNEDDEDFRYNLYYCLECGSSIQVEASDYEEFEANHTVIKIFQPEYYYYEKMHIIFKEEYRKALLEKEEDETIDHIIGFAKTFKK